VNHQRSLDERVDSIRLAGSTTLFALNMLVWLFALSDGAWVFFGYTTLVSIGMAGIVVGDIRTMRRRN
jgi:hypothetical protein